MTVCSVSTQGDILPCVHVVSDPSVLVLSVQLGMTDLQSSFLLSAIINCTTNNIPSTVIVYKVATQYWTAC